MSAAAVISLFTADVIVLIVIFTLAFIDAMRSGTGRIVAASIALPLASVFIAVATKASLAGPFIAQAVTSRFSAALFGGVCVLLFLLLRRMTVPYGEMGATLPIAALAACVLTAIATSIWVSTPPLDALWHFGTVIRAIVAPAYQFWILIVGYVLLAFVRS